MCVCVCLVCVLSVWVGVVSGWCRVCCTSGRGVMVANIANGLEYLLLLLLEFILAQHRDAFTEVDEALLALLPTQHHF